MENNTTILNFWGGNQGENPVLNMEISSAKINEVGKIFEEFAEAKTYQVVSLFRAGHEPVWRNNQSDVKFYNVKGHPVTTETMKNVLEDFVSPQKKVCWKDVIGIRNKLELGVDSNSMRIEVWVDYNHETNLAKRKTLEDEIRNAFHFTGKQEKWNLHHE
jgi:hypothetical protein